ncbi:dipeptidase [Bacillus sp. FSL W7-1360]
MFPIVDTHCDALCKLATGTAQSFVNDPTLETNLERLQRGRVRCQLFALYVPPSVKQENMFAMVRKQIAAFHQAVLTCPNMVHIRSLSEIATLKDGQIGAGLTLEGMDAIGRDRAQLSWLYEQGILAIGLTWNDANMCADGVGEKRGAGLTSYGESVIAENNTRGVVNDVSHLSVRAFWDVMAQSKKTMASHSNAYTVCPHRRNLRDDQLDALIKTDSFIGLVFYPPFVTNKDEACLDDLLPHIDHIGSRGGIKHIGFGSDFDGIDTYVTGLSHAGCYDTLINHLLKFYREEEVRGFCSRNFMEKVVRH